MSGVEVIGVMREIAAAKLFSGLTVDEIKEILAAAAARRFGSSDIIIQNDTPATHLYVVKKGCADYCILTESGRKILLRRMVPGNAFGVAAFLSQPVGYLGLATAVGDLEVLAWERRLVRQLAMAYPRLAENALRIALHYVAILAGRHARLVADSAPERLAGALTSVAARAGHLLSDGMEVDIRNEDLAALADVSLFTTSRLLQHWERAGAVQKNRGKVLIRCPERLLA